jgi:hypothetical protein
MRIVKGVKNMADYNKLRDLLEQNKIWPKMYMFKFVVPNSQGKVDRVKSILQPLGDLSFKNTANLKFVSVTCTAVMPNAVAVIEVYREVSVVEGVLAL